MKGQQFLTLRTASVEIRVFGGLCVVSKQKAFEYVVEDGHTVEDQGIF